MKTLVVFLSVFVAVSVVAKGLSMPAGRSPANGVVPRRLAAFNGEFMKRELAPASLSPTDWRAVTLFGCGLAASVRDSSKDGGATMNEELDSTLKQLLTAITASPDRG